MILLASLATVLGLVPLAWCLGLRSRGRRVDAAYWWLAAAFAVSFVADVAGAFGLTPYASQLYPVMQAALIAVVLLERPAFVAYVALLVFAAALSIAWRNAGGYDLVLRAVSWGGVAALAWALVPPEKATIRWTLAAGFAAQLLAWIAFTVDPGWDGWLALQLARLGTAIGFCAAASREA